MKEKTKDVISVDRFIQISSFLLFLFNGSQSTVVIGDDFSFENNSVWSKTSRSIFVSPLVSRPSLSIFVVCDRISQSFLADDDDDMQWRFRLLPTFFFCILVSYFCFLSFGRIRWRGRENDWVVAFHQDD